MRILVTGGAGFIGSHVVEHYHKTAEVVVLENLRTGFRENISDLSCELIEGSVTNPDDINHAMKGADYVSHLAAFISAPDSVDKPEERELINTQGTFNLLNNIYFQQPSYRDSNSS